MGLAKGSFWAWQPLTEDYARELRKAVSRFIEIYNHKPALCIVSQKANLPDGFMGIKLVQHSFGHNLFYLAAYSDENLKWLRTAASDDVRIIEPGLELPEEDTDKRRAGRPLSLVNCPFCDNKVSPEQLGWWDKWSEGKPPPYWNRLRSYIFHRDKETCKECGGKFDHSFLTVYHIQPKETGGTDSSRNLITLCINCRNKNE